MSGPSNENVCPGQKYRNEWQQLLLCLEKNNRENLKKLAFNGDLKSSKHRSICWAVLLRVLSANVSNWPEERQKQRQRYQKLKSEFSINPHSKNIVNDDPLSQSEQSVWNQYFDDQNLLTAIQQDVTRTFPGVEFFKRQTVQTSMNNILFYYAREHPYMCYRQGMHEILAPILFVVNFDHQSLLHFIEISGNIEDKLLLDVLNPKDFEADSYSIFSRIMFSIESYYKITNFKPTAGGYFPVQSKNDEEMSSTAEVLIIGQLNLIRDKILAKEDQHLHNHLMKLDIQMHIFGIRWLRVLFGREFPFLDLLMLWDAIFADSDKFDLPNYIVVAMLIRIRDKLLLSDYTTCLMHLMKYPSNSDICLILRHALHLLMPQVYDRPSNAFIYVTMNPEVMKSLTMSTHVKTTSKKKTANSNSLSNQNLNKASRSSTLDEVRSKMFLTESNTFYSEDKSRVQPINSKIAEIKCSNAMQSARFEKLDAAKHAGENVIIDGFSENSEEYLRLELQNAQTIVTVSRLKLNNYLRIFRKYITRKDPEELNQAVDGIEELCAFLDFKFSIPAVPFPLQVDQALEATSDPQSPFVSVDSAYVSTIKMKPRNHKMTEAEVKTEFVKILEASKNPFEIEVDKDGNSLGFKSGNVKIVEQAEAVPTAVQVSPSKCPDILNTGTRYEIPDVGFMKNSQKILGTRMNVELTIFKEEHETEDHEGIPIVDPLGVRDS